MCTKSTLQRSWCILFTCALFCSTVRAACARWLSPVYRRSICANALTAAFCKTQMINRTERAIISQFSRIKTSSFYINQGQSFVYSCCGKATVQTYRQFGTKFHRSCKAQTPGNSLSIALSTGCSSVLMAEGVPYKWTYLQSAVRFAVYRHLAEHFQEQTENISVWRWRTLAHLLHLRIWAI